MRRFSVFCFITSDIQKILAQTRRCLAAELKLSGLIHVNESAPMFYSKYAARAWVRALVSSTVISRSELPINETKL